MMWTHAILFHRVLLCGGVLLFGAWILNAHVPFFGVTKITYRPGTVHPLIGRLRPLDRVQLIAYGEKKRIVEKVLEDPVYVEVRTRVPYRAVTIEMVYINTSRASVRIGLRSSLTGTAARYVPFDLIRESDGWETRRAVFHLDPSERLGKKYHFLISFPGVQYEYPERGHLLLGQMTFRFERDPLFMRL